jgi:hypothetical protein
MDFEPDPAAFYDKLVAAVLGSGAKKGVARSQ